MDSKDIGKKITGGLFWSFGERIVAQLVSTLVTIVLARLLEPEHYGIISIVTVFITLCNVFVASGFGSALVQKKEADALDFNTALYISLGMSAILYVALYFLAPYIADFYQMPLLTPVIRVMGFRLPLAAVNNIQQAFVRREMKFKRFFISTLFGTVISGFAGVGLAIAGWGVWALVAQYLTNTTIDTIVLFAVGGWRPKWQFSWTRARAIFDFGWKVLASELIFTLEADIRSLVIGKVFGSEDLAYFDQGKKYPSLVVTNINASINKVMLPAFSANQDDIPKLKQMLRKSISISVFLIGPILLGFAAISEEFVLIVLGEKWLPAVPFIQLFCIAYLTRPLQTACHQALLAIGKSKLVMYIMLAISTISLTTLVVAAFYFHSVIGIAIGYIISELFALGIFMVMAAKLLGYRIREQIVDLWAPLAIGAAMYAAVTLLNLSNRSAVEKLGLKMVVGVGTYTALSLMAQLPVVKYITENIRKRRKNR